MSKEEPLVVEGVVIELLPSLTFRVKIVQSDPTKAEMQVIAHLCGKMRRGFIRLCVGDRVTVEMTPYDLTKGRIKYRLK